ncbi:Ig-like domain-containing protein [Escherichia coli]
MIFIHHEVTIFSLCCHTATTGTLTAQVNLNVTENNFIANNIGMTILQATVIDGNGNPLANEAVTFTLPADVSASFTLGQGGSAITDINGKAEVTLSGTKSGTYPVTVDPTHVIWTQA